MKISFITNPNEWQSSFEYDYLENRFEVMARHYLKPHRLEEVLFLIQQLGMGKHANLPRNSNALGKPKSASSWQSLAKCHPEFFDVTTGESVRLAFRYLSHEAREQSGFPPPINPNDVQALIKTAMEIHECQIQSAGAWKIWVTMIAAAIAAVASVLEALNLLK